MVLKTTVGNILELDSTKYIAHAISGDYVMGAGLAKRINHKYDMAKKLHMEFPTTLNQYDGEALRIGNIFNLIVKREYSDRVEKGVLYSSLEDLKEQCIMHGIEEICMPQICCGKEKMVWNEVKEIIEDVFFGTNITVNIFVLPANDDSAELRRLKKLNRRMANVIRKIYGEDTNKVLTKIGYTEEELEKMESERRETIADRK